MVNGKTLEDELRYIDDFFDSMSSSEFEEILIECGVQVNSDISCSTCEYRDVNVPHTCHLCVLKTNHMNDTFCQE